MADEQTKREMKLSPTGLKLAEYEFSYWVAAVDVGVTPAEMLEPSFWSHVSSKLKPWDHVEVRQDDGSYWAELLVLACDRMWAKMHLLREAKLSTPDVSLSQADARLRVEWKGPRLKHCVIRVKDGEIMTSEIQSRADAEAWVREHPQVA